MKRNLILLIIALLLGGLTFWLVTRREHSTVKKELRDFAVQDTASITKIFLADKADHQVTLTREKNPDGSTHWLVDGKYEARPDAILYLLRTIHDVSVRQPVGLKARDHIIKELATGSTKCEIYAGDKLIKQYYVGGESPDGLGTYMLMSDVSDPDDIVNSAEPFETEIKGVNAYLTTRYFATLIDWRDRTVFHYFVPDIRSIRVDHFREPQNTFVVTQAAGSKVFNLQDAKGKTLPFDTLTLKQYISYYGRIGFQDFITVIDKARKDSILNSPPAFRITVTDASNKQNVVTMWLKKSEGQMPEDSSAAPPQPYDPDVMYATVNDGKDFVYVQFYVFGKLLQDPAYFLGRKKQPGNGSR